MQKIGQPEGNKVPTKNFSRPKRKQASFHKPFSAPALLQFILILLALALVGLALHSVSLGKVWAILRRLSLGELLLLGGVNIAILFAISGRWWVILRALGVNLSYIWITLYRLAGFGVSYLTPGPQFGGEPVQVLLLCRTRPISTEKAIASVAVEKLFELLANFVVLAVGILYILKSHLLIGFLDVRIAGLSLLLLIIPVVLLLNLQCNWGGLSRLATLFLGEKSSKFGIGRVANLVRSTEAEASRLLRQQPALFWKTLLFSILNWAGIFAEFWLVNAFLGIYMNPFQLVVAVVAMRAAFLSPTPGGFGVLEVGLLLTYKALGLAPAAALAVCGLIRIRDLSLAISGLVFGGIHLFSSSLPKISRTAEHPIPRKL